MKKALKNETMKITKKTEESKDEKTTNKDAEDPEGKMKNEKKKVDKKQIKRIKLDENNLLYGPNGLRKFYDIIMNTNFNSSKEVNLMFVNIS